MTGKPTEFDRMMAAAYDSPGETITRGQWSIRVSKTKISPRFAYRLMEAMTRLDETTPHPPKENDDG